MGPERFLVNTRKVRHSKSIEILGAYVNQMLKAICCFFFFLIFSGKESTFMEAAGLPVRVEFFTGLPI